MADEVQWLTGTRGETMTFTFAELDPAVVRDLAERYRTFAAKLTVRTFLLGGRQPIFEHVADTANRVSVALDAKANKYPAVDKSNPKVELASIELPTGYISRRDDLSSRAVSRIGLQQLVADRKPVSVDLDVSWFKDKPHHPEDMPGNLSHGREYNGYLPALRALKFERDLSLGNYSLHVELGGTYYSEHQELSKPGEAADSFTLLENTLVGKPSLLTLVTLPVTKDGYLIFAERGDIAYYPRCWGPGVGGNLEIPRTGGPSSDLDDNGVIDPKRAVVREAQEEIGVRIQPERVNTLGIARVANAEEVGTWILVTSTFTDLSLEEIADATVSASLVDGRWEVCDYLLAVPVPRSSRGVESLLSWALRNPSVMPHLTAALILFFGADRFAYQLHIRKHACDRRTLPPGGMRFRFGQQLSDHK